MGKMRHNESLRLIFSSIIKLSQFFLLIPDIIPLSLARALSLSLSIGRRRSTESTNIIYPILATDYLQVVHIRNQEELYLFHQQIHARTHALIMHYLLSIILFLRSFLSIVEFPIGIAAEERLAQLGDHLAAHELQSAVERVDDAQATVASQYLHPADSETRTHRHTCTQTRD